MKILWCDRQIYKISLQKWLLDKGKFNAIGISDSQELQDIVNWIKDNAPEMYSIGMAHYDSDVEIKKHSLLEVLTIGEGEIFQNFYKTLNEIETTSNLSMKQEIGNNASSEGQIKYEYLSQTMNIFGSTQEKVPPEVLKEREINKIFNGFIYDINKNNGKHSFLFLIRFGKKGFNDLSAEFRNWFLQFFCRKMMLLENIKICILNQGNVDIFKEFSINGFENIPEHLELEDIVTEIKNPNYIPFCEGAVDPKDNRIQYYDFKRRLVMVYMKKYG